MDDQQLDSQSESTFTPPTVKPGQPQVDPNIPQDLVDKEAQAMLETKKSEVKSKLEAKDQKTTPDELTDNSSESTPTSPTPSSPPPSTPTPAQNPTNQNISTPPPLSPPTPGATTPSPTNSAPQTPTPSPDQKSKDAKPKKPKKKSSKKKLTMVAGALGALVIAFGGLAAFNLSQQSQENRTSASPGSFGGDSYGLTMTGSCTATYNGDGDMTTDGCESVTITHCQCTDEEIASARCLQRCHPVGTANIGDTVDFCQYMTSTEYCNHQFDFGGGSHGSCAAITIADNCGSPPGEPPAPPPVVLPPACNSASMSIRPQIPISGQKATITINTDYTPQDQYTRVNAHLDVSEGYPTDCVIFAGGRNRWHSDWVTNQNTFTTKITPNISGNDSCSIHLSFLVERDGLRDNCQADLRLNIKPPVTACNDACTMGNIDKCTQDLGPEYSCISGFCRLTTNPTSETCEPLLACNSLCDQTTECQEVNQDYICYTPPGNDISPSDPISYCRHQDYPESETCTPPPVYACNSACTQDAQCTGDLGPDYQCYFDPAEQLDGRATGNCRLIEYPESEVCLPPEDNSFVCYDLTSDIGTPKIGDTVNFTCSTAGNGASFVNRFEFRYSVDDGAYTEIGYSTPLTNDLSSQPVTLVVTQPGSYRVECRVCQDDQCTPWGASEAQ